MPESCFLVYNTSGSSTNVEIENRILMFASCAAEIFRRKNRENPHSTVTRCDLTIHELLRKYSYKKCLVLYGAIMLDLPQSRFWPLEPAPGAGPRPPLSRWLEFPVGDGNASSSSATTSKT